MLSLCFLTMMLVGVLSTPGPAPATHDAALRQPINNYQPAIPYRMVAAAPAPQPSGKARVVPAPKTPRPTPEPPPLQHSPAPTPGQRGTTTVYVYNVYQYPPPAAQPAVDPMSRMLTTTPFSPPRETLTSPARSILCAASSIMPISPIPTPTRPTTTFIVTWRQSGNVRLRSEFITGECMFQCRLPGFILMPAPRLAGASDGFASLKLVEGWRGKRQPSFSEERELTKRHYPELA